MMECKLNDVKSPVVIVKHEEHTDNCQASGLSYNIKQESKLKSRPQVMYTVKEEHCENNNISNGSDITDTIGQISCGTISITNKAVIQGDVEGVECDRNRDVSIFKIENDGMEFGSPDIKTELLSSDQIMRPTVEECQFCNYDVSTISHIELHADSDMCVICKKRLVQHVDQTSQHSEPPYTCGSFTQQKELSSHNKSCAKKKPFKCDICDIEFPSSHTLRIHKKIHLEKEPFRCDICSILFTEKRDLNNHHCKSIDHPDNKFYCEVCGKGFKKNGHLTRHQLIHTGEKPFKCDVCGKGFTQSGDLKIHRRQHTGDKPFRCDKCGMLFSQLQHLKCHLQRKHDEKLHECDVCGKGFVNSKALKDHKGIHIGIWPHTCDECGKGFLNSRDLVRHTRTHTGEKPYKCDVCDKAFTLAHHLTRHSRTHTGA